LPRSARPCTHHGCAPPPLPTNGKSFSPPSVHHPGALNVNCTGACSAGYACPAGSVSPTALLCTAGTYSPPGSGACLPCPSGVYGTANATAVASCTAPCPAGRYGTPGASSPACTGPCSSGFLCPAGSSNATAVPCPAGKYSVGGDLTCTVRCVPHRRANVTAAMLHEHSGGQVPRSTHGSCVVDVQKPRVLECWCSLRRFNSLKLC
jgi:hypothetical protein